MWSCLMQGKEGEVIGVVEGRKNNYNNESKEDCRQRPRDEEEEVALSGGETISPRKADVSTPIKKSNPQAKLWQGRNSIP
jgi:hypothetical protein